jgi:hypothetical protein
MAKQAAKMIPYFQKEHPKKILLDFIPHPLRMVSEPKCSKIGQIESKQRYPPSLGHDSGHKEACLSRIFVPNSSVVNKFFKKFNKSTGTLSLLHGNLITEPDICESKVRTMELDEFRLRSPIRARSGESHYQMSS